MYSFRVIVAVSFLYILWFKHNIDYYHDPYLGILTQTVYEVSDVHKTLIPFQR